MSDPIFTLPIDSSDDESKEDHLKKRGLEVSKLIDHELSITDEIYDPKFSALCLFAILESFVQEHNNYSQGKEQEKFTDFIVSFQRSWPFLESTDPITLYYHIEHLEKSAFKNVNIGTLKKGRIYETKTMQESIFAEQVYKSLEKFDSKKKSKLLEQHRYVDLLYRLRCRLSHELGSPFAISNKDVENRNFEPYYQCIYKLDVQNDNAVLYDPWELHYPLCFIRALIHECTHNYIEDCIGKGRDPFLNLEHQRICDLTWYYK